MGVDGSPPGQAALRFALDEARVRGARLDVIHVWRLAVSESVPDAFLLETPLEPSFPLGGLEESVERAARGRLDAAIRDVLKGADPGVELRSEAVEGEPARVLLERAQGADLLVVGARGRGGFTGLLLGSVSSQCAHHASCPVVIVPGAVQDGDRR